MRGAAARFRLQVPDLRDGPKGMRLGMPLCFRTSSSHFSNRVGKAVIIHVVHGEPEEEL